MSKVRLVLSFFFFVIVIVVCYYFLFLIIIIILSQLCLKCASWVCCFSNALLWLHLQ